MDDRARLAGVLRVLEELGCRELFLDDLTTEEALALAAGSAPSPADAGNPLAALEARAEACQKCGLSGSRTNVVFARGSGTGGLMVVGEAPGGEEDRMGLPFVGPAGKLLDLLLLTIGFHRGSVYICNVLKCRPPKNRDPRPEEVAACSPYLRDQLQAVAPRAVLAVGRFAAQMLAGSDASIGRLRGRVHRHEGVPVVATYHPAYLLRTPSATRDAWQDLQLLKQVLDEPS